MGLETNEKKTKYMKMTSSEARRWFRKFNLGNFEFGVVGNVGYLTSFVTQDKGASLWSSG